MSTAPKAMPECYSALDRSRREIRVLRPRQLGERRLDVVMKDPTSDITTVPDILLEFKLETVSLDDRPVFTALSYVWGDPEGIEPIGVEDETILITRNLHTALKHLQCEDIAPALWVDSLCINQSDDTEKSHQIQMMRNIYSNAAHVVVWLGEATEHSDFLAKATREVAKNFRRKFNVPTPEKYSLIDYFDVEILQDEKDLVDLIEQSCSTAEDPQKRNMQATEFSMWLLVFMTCREWWYRVWIIQEFVYAKKVFFQVGCKKISLNEIRILLCVIIFYGQLSFSTPFLGNKLQQSIFVKCPGWEWPMHMLVQREKNKDESLVSDIYEVLCGLYCRTSQSDNNRVVKARDQRDYIYGLLGLFETHFYELCLKVDYMKNWQTVYSEVAGRLLESGNLDLLTLCQTSDPLDTDGLPTWAPNWQKQVLYPNVWYKTTPRNSRAILGNSLFNASASTQCHAKLTFGPQEHPVMRIRGVQVDTVLDVKSIYLGSKAMRPQDAKPLLGTLFREIDALRQQSRQLGFAKYSHTQLCEAQWRMPIRDHELDLNDESESHHYQRGTPLSRTRYLQHLPLFKASEAELKIDDLQRSESTGWWWRWKILWQKGRFHFYITCFSLQKNASMIFTSIIHRAKFRLGQWLGIQCWASLSRSSEQDPRDDTLPYNNDRASNAAFYNATRLHWARPKLYGTRR